MIKTRLLSYCSLALTALVGCATEASSSERRPKPITAGAAGLHEENGALVFRTEPFTLPSGGERYLCWTLKTDRPLKVRVIEFAGSSGIHHVTFAQTRVPEPEGWSECEVLLKSTWLPLFSVGAGANKLSFPTGVAHELAAGTQLLVQLHLLNVTDEDVTKAMQLRLEVTDEADTKPVKIGGFGSFRVSLPAHQKTKITHECQFPSNSRVLALTPHMHQLGRSITLEIGNSPNELAPFYMRDPWDFDQQSTENIDLVIEAGKHARVTCSYDNTTDRTVSYGESAFDEMCFVGVFSSDNAINCVAF